MNDWFEWNGKKCTEYGIHVSEHPSITLPAERATYTNVPGRSGSLTTLEGDAVYDDIILTATCFISDTSRLNEISSWLRGGGIVTFANREGGFYYARVVNQISFDKIMRGKPHRSFAVNFRCKPFWYEKDVKPITVTGSGYQISNPGNVDSVPIITVYGNGDATLMVGMTIVELTGIEESITVDSILQETYKGTDLQNNRMSGDFPVLKPGRNAVSWTGNISRIVIEPNWRYL